MKVDFDISGKRAVGELVKKNEKTTWVRWRGMIIKRHNIKHDVKIGGTRGANNDQT